MSEKRLIQSQDVSAFFGKAKSLKLTPDLTTQMFSYFRYHAKDVGFDEGAKLAVLERSMSDNLLKGDTGPNARTEISASQLDQWVSSVSLLEPVVATSQPFVEKLLTSLVQSASQSRVALSHEAQLLVMSYWVQNWVNHHEKCELSSDHLEHFVQLSRRLGFSVELDNRLLRSFVYQAEAAEFPTNPEVRRQVGLPPVNRRQGATESIF